MTARRARRTLAFVVVLFSTTGIGRGAVIVERSIDLTIDGPSFVERQHLVVALEELGDLDISAFDADPDKDFLTNAAEYAFGSDPRMADGKRKLRVTKEKIDGEFHQFVEYYRPKNALDVAYRVLLSNDTLTWNFNGDDTDLVYSVERSVEAVDDETELVTVELYPETDSPKSFFVKISALLFE